MGILQDLEFRGLINQQTDAEGLEQLLEKALNYTVVSTRQRIAYIGHMLPVLMLRRFQLAGHQPIALVGGGTGMIGDPSGKKQSVH